jgi:hypothetical protein
MVLNLGTHVATTPFPNVVGEAGIEPAARPRNGNPNLSACYSRAHRRDYVAGVYFQDNPETAACARFNNKLNIKHGI